MRHGLGMLCPRRGFLSAILVSPAQTTGHVGDEKVLLSLPASLGPGEERRRHWDEGLLGGYVSPCSANITSGQFICVRS